MCIENSNYVAAVPVIVKGKRKNNSTYKFKSRMPISRFGLKPKSIPLNQDLAHRHALVRRMVDDELSDALYEVSA